jgi:hypothetical protein
MKFDTWGQNIPVSGYSPKLYIGRDYEEDPKETKVLITYGEGPDHGHITLDDAGAQALQQWLNRYLKWRSK